MPDASFALDARLTARFDTLSTACEQPRDVLIRRALERFLEEEEQLSADLREAEEDFAAGRFVTHEELVAEIRALRREKRAA